MNAILFSSENENDLLFAVFSFASNSFQFSWKAWQNY